MGAIVIDLLRLVATLRAEYRAAAELLSLALEQIRALDAELDRVRARYHEVLAERLEQRRGERPAA
jgi:hypothetical protein